jgi:hypothetical protein
VSSKFKGLLDAAKKRDGATEASAGPKRSRKPRSQEEVARPPKAAPIAQPGPEPTPKRRGRPPGKRSNPGYEPVTIYISKTTHRACKIGLLTTNPDNLDFSELAEQLLRAWAVQNGYIDRDE